MSSSTRWLAAALALTLVACGGCKEDGASGPEAAPSTARPSQADEQRPAPEPGSSADLAGDARSPACEEGTVEVAFTLDFPGTLAELETRLVRELAGDGLLTTVRSEPKEHRVISFLDRPGALRPDGDLLLRRRTQGCKKPNQDQTHTELTLKVRGAQLGPVKVLADKVRAAKIGWDRCKLETDARASRIGIVRLRYSASFSSPKTKRDGPCLNAESAAWSAWPAVEKLLQALPLGDLAKLAVDQRSATETRFEIVGERGGGKLEFDLTEWQMDCAPKTRLRELSFKVQGEQAANDLAGLVAKRLGPLVTSPTGKTRWLYEQAAVCRKAED